MVAREVQATDPQVLRDLATVRLGTAYFRRALQRVRNDEFAAPSLLPGWRREQLVAHVGYNARAVARLVTWAATGVETPMYASPEARAEEIEAGATLRPDALRSLCEHAAIDLDVRWRDLPDDRWGATVVTAQGREVPASETLWMRSREVWLHAVDLRNGGSVDDFPEELIDLLLADLIAVWRRKLPADAQDIVLEPIDRENAFGIRQTSDDTSLIVRGSARDLVAWGTGRGSRGVLTAAGDPPPAAPGWL